MTATIAPRIVQWLFATTIMLFVHGCAADSAASNKPEQLPHDRAVTSLPDQLGHQPSADHPERSAHPLAQFYEGLKALEAQPDGEAVVRITQIGDSHTASDTFTGPVRSALQDRFGDGGRGYLAAGRPWRSYRQRNASYDMSDGWSPEIGLYGHSEDYALSGTRIHTDAGGEWIKRGPCTQCGAGKTAEHLQVFYLTQPNGGAFDVRIDGVRAARVQSDADDENIGVFEMPLDGHEHTVHIETVGDGTVTLFGTSMRDGGGVILDSIGLNGAQLRHYLAFNEHNTRDEMASLSPDLVIIAFGANEAMARRYRVKNPITDAVELLEKLQNYHREILELLERYREAVPSAECLILLPPDMLAGSDAGCIDYTFESAMLSGRRCVQQPAANFAGILNAQRYAAQSAGCAVWDQQRAMGGEGSMDIWRELRFAARDGVHLRSEGYRLLADAFVSDLLENYETWRNGEVQELPTHVIFPELATTAREHP